MERGYEGAPGWEDRGRRKGITQDCATGSKRREGEGEGEGEGVNGEFASPGSYQP